MPTVDSARPASWSYRPDLHIGLDDVDWVAETLMKNGNREAWQVGRSLCL